MQFIILLLLLSFTCHAKKDYCNFSSDFADKYMEARKNYAQRLREKRERKEADPEVKVISGGTRAKMLSANWEQVSIKQIVKKLFNDNEIEIKVKTNGKMLLYPKNIIDGAPLIVFDPAGDYFRIARAHVRNGVVKQELKFFDIDGKPIVGSATDKAQEDYEKFARRTHFQALP